MSSNTPSSNDITNGGKKPYELAKVECRPQRAEEDHFVIACFENNRVVLRIAFQRLRTVFKVFIYTPFLREPLVFRTRIRNGNVSPSDITNILNSIRSSELARSPKLLSIVEEVLTNIEQWIDRWDEIVSTYRTLSDLVSDEPPVAMTIVTDQGVMEVLSDNIVWMPILGGVVVKDNRIYVAESTITTARVHLGDDVVERRAVMGLLAVYERNSDNYVLKQIVPYSDLHRYINVDGDYIGFESAYVFKKLSIPTLPKLSLLQSIMHGTYNVKTWKEVADRIVEKLRRYVVFDDPKLYDVVACFIIATYFADYFGKMPFLVLYGAPASGKTTTATVILFMSRRGVMLVKPTEASLFRLAEGLKPVLILNETRLNDDMLKLLNAMHDPYSYVARVEQRGEQRYVELYSITTPVIVTLIELPTASPDGYAFLTRNIIINMKRAQPPSKEMPKAEEFVDIRNDLYALRLLRFNEVVEAVPKADQVIDELGLIGRDKDVWRPIIVAAILAGRLDSVKQYIAEARRSAELWFEETDEIIVLRALDRYIAWYIGEHKLQDVDPSKAYIEFSAGDLVPYIIDILAEGSETLRKKLEKQWNPRKVGKILQRLGFDRYKYRTATKRGYRITVEIFMKICERYNYEPTETLSAYNPEALISEVEQRVEEKQEPQQAEVVQKEERVEHQKQEGVEKQESIEETILKLVSSECQPLSKLVQAVMGDENLLVNVINKLESQGLVYTFTLGIEMFVCRKHGSQV